MEYEMMTALFSVATFFSVWLYSKPQKVEMRAMREKQEIESLAFRETLNNNTDAIKDLTQKIADDREERAAINEKLKTLFENYKTLQAEIEGMRSEMLKCRRGDN